MSISIDSVHFLEMITSLVGGEFCRYLVHYSGGMLAREAFPQHNRNFSQLEPALSLFVGVGGHHAGGDLLISRVVKRTIKEIKVSMCA